MIDKTLCFILGSAVGSWVTYLIMRKKTDAEKAEEFRLMKEHYESLYGTEQKPKRVYVKSAKSDTEEKKDDIVVLGSAEAQKRSKDAKSDYTSYNKSGKEERMISLITSERFANEEPEYEKITLSYYEKDGILADTYGDTVDIESSIGDKGIEYFELLHQDVIYVRNSRLKIDYEIVLEHMAYSELYETGFRDDID